MLELIISKANVTLREFHFYGTFHWLKVNTVISFFVVVLFLREREKDLWFEVDASGS